MNTGFSDTLSQAITEGKIMGYQALWNSCLIFIQNHWVGVILILGSFFVIAIIRAITGYWGMLGSLLYHTFFLGFLLIIGLIFGPAIFASGYAPIWLFLLYLVCYSLVGRILDWTELRRRY